MHTGHSATLYMWVFPGMGTFLFTFFCSPGAHSWQGSGRAKRPRILALTLAVLPWKRYLTALRILVSQELIRGLYCKMEGKRRTLLLLVSLFLGVGLKQISSEIRRRLLLKQARAMTG